MEREAPPGQTEERPLLCKNLESVCPFVRFGLVRKRERHVLTWRGWAALLALVAMALTFAGWFVRNHIVAFLAKTERLPARLLVVEGWIPDYNFTQVKEEFQTGRYQLLIVTGNPMLKGEALVEYKDYPELTRASLLRRGWDPARVVAVSSREVLRDRTYSAARALREWLVRHPNFQSLNVMSFSVHARRTWLLYKMALEGVAQVGIIAGQDESFDPAFWWRSSEGVRSTLDETVAYLYCRILFHPPPLGGG